MEFVGNTKKDATRINELKGIVNKVVDDNTYKDRLYLNNLEQVKKEFENFIKKLEIVEECLREDDEKNSLQIEKLKEMLEGLNAVNEADRSINAVAQEVESATK